MYSTNEFSSYYCFWKRIIKISNRISYHSNLKTLCLKIIVQIRLLRGKREIKAWLTKLKKSYSKSTHTLSVPYFFSA